MHPKHVLTLLCPPVACPPLSINPSLAGFLYRLLFLPLLLHIAQTERVSKFINKSGIMIPDMRGATSYFVPGTDRVKMILVYCVYVALFLF